MTVRDLSGTEIQSFLAGPTSLRLLPEEEEIIARSGTVDLKLRRRVAGQGYGTTQVFAPVDVQLGFGSKRLQIDAWDQLQYSSTHHNWSDSLVGRADGLTLRWWVEFPPEGPNRLVHRVSVTADATGEVVLPETIIQAGP